MDQGWAALLGAMIGGSAAIFGGLWGDWARHRRLTKGILVALGAEMRSLVAYVEARGYEATYADVVGRLTTGGAGASFRYERQDVAILRTPIYNAYADKLGYLPTPAASKIVEFYTLFDGLQIDFRDLLLGAFDDDRAAMLEVLQAGLNLMGRCRELSAEVTGSAQQ